MSPNQVNDFVSLWKQEEVRVFYLKRHIYNSDVVVIIRESDDFFQCLKEYSTFDIKTLNKEKIALLLMKKELHWVDVFNYKQAKKLVTNGCTCGGWLSKDGHYDWCRRD